MTRYKFKGYTITNCGYHQPDHCVWWEAVNENGEACFHGNTLREVEFEILDYEWEQKMNKKDEEIERLKREKAEIEANALAVGGVVEAARHKPCKAAAMREALEYVLQFDATDEAAEQDGLTDAERIAEYADHISECQKKARAALSAPARNCDLKECSTYDGMISAHESFCESWHDDGKTCAECPYNPRLPKMTCREKWLLAPAAERKGEGDGR